MKIGLNESEGAVMKWDGVLDGERKGEFRFGWSLWEESFG